MSWGTPAVIASDQNKTANQTSFVSTLSAGASVGDLLLWICAKDNAQTADGDQNLEVVNVSGTKNNLWSRVRNWANGATVQTTTACCVWACQVTTAMIATDTITAEFAGTTSANDAQCAIVVKFSPSAGNVVGIAGAAGLSTDAADPDDITLGSLPSAEYLWVWALAAEGPDTDAYTIDSDYTAITGTGTTGGVDTSNQHIRAAYRVFTGTTDTVSTSSDTADRDYAQVLVAFKEVSFSATGAAGGVHILGGTVVR